MSAYRTLLVAVDLREDTEQVIAQAQALRQAFGSRLELLHVVEPVPLDAGAETVMPSNIHIERDYIDKAERELSELAQRLELAKDQWHVAMGQTKREILHRAKRTQADLIVVGSHGRHGLALLLGSTANSVLHGAPCDVLAVRLDD